MKAVEDGLRRLDGVERIKTDLQRNLVTMTPARRVAPDLASIPRVIAEAGFRPGRMWITAHGATEELAAGQPGFRIDGWPAGLPLSGSTARGRRKIEGQVVYSDDEIRLRLPE